MNYILAVAVAALAIFVDRTIVSLIDGTIVNDRLTGDGWFSEAHLARESEETRQCGVIMRCVWIGGMLVAEALILLGWLHI